MLEPRHEEDSDVVQCADLAWTLHRPQYLDMVLQSGASDIMSSVHIKRVKEIV